MVYKVVRTDYHNDEIVDVVSIGRFVSRQEAEDSIQEGIDDFREHHDNDERLDWNAVEAYDDIGNCDRVVWDLTEE